MPKVTLIVGLPGSGKTHMAHSLVEDNKQLHQPVFFDDMTHNELKEAEKAVKNGNDVYIADPWLCYPSSFSAAKKKIESWDDVQLAVIYFENDPEACLENVKNRADGRKVENFIRYASQHYVIPEGSLKYQVWRALDKPPSTMQR